MYTIHISNRILTVGTYDSDGNRRAGVLVSPNMRQINGILSDLECYRLQNGKWPVLEDQNTLPDKGVASSDLTLPFHDNNMSCNKLSLLYLKEWRWDELYEFCGNNMFDMYIIEKIDEKDNKLRGLVMRCEPTMSHSRYYFENLMELD